MLLHFTVQPYDPQLDYEHICKSLFGQNKCLVIVEKKNGEHAHIQGELEEELTDWDWRRVCKTISSQHYKRKHEPKCNPVKKRRLEADDTGYQYMVKELPSSAVIYKQGFTDDDLEELYEKSNEHREELKAKLGEYLVQEVVRGSGESPRKLHHRLCGAALRYYMDQDKMCPPNIKLLVRHFMLKYWGKDLDVFEYLSELIM